MDSEENKLRRAEINKNCLKNLRNLDLQSGMCCIK